MNYGLIGEHLGHSYSKLIQEKMLDNYTYEIHPIPRDEVDSFMTKKEFKAINVTIPYKRTVIPYIDELDDAAKKIGAVNTVVNKDGKLYGHNTDYYGFAYMLDKHNIDVKDKVVLVLGNGGASQAIQVALKDAGAKELLVTDLILKPGIITIEDAYTRADEISVVVNTTPCGMYPKVNNIACDLSKFKNCFAVLDCIYNPMDTEFTLQAKELGMKAGVTGLEMLVGQAKRALEFFKDIEIDNEVIDRIYREILEGTSNLAFISSNTDLASSIAKELDKECIVITKDNLKDSVILSNKVLCVSKEIFDTHPKEFKRNSFVVEASTKEEAIAKFKQEVQNYNN